MTLVCDRKLVSVLANFFVVSVQGGWDSAVGVVAVGNVDRDTHRQKLLFLCERT